MLKAMPAFMQIDHELSSDLDGRRLKQRQDQLKAGRETLRRKIDGGVASTEHPRLKAAYDAYAAGERIVPKLWEQLRKG